VTQSSFVLTGIARASVLGLPIAICNYTQAVGLLRTWAQEANAPLLVAAANTHLVATARRDKQFARAMEKFDLVVPDGMPLVWYLNRIHNARLTNRVYGPDLMRRVLAVAGTTDRHFLLGGTEAERRKLEQVLRNEYPRARVAGSYSPPFGEWPSGENEKIIRLLRDVEANFVWVGLGCPKQELLLARLKGALPPGVYIAVGAAFPLISGTVKQAPTVWQNLGLEWAFRLLMEPRRLWRRYLVNNTQFIFYTGLELLRKIYKDDSPGRDGEK
jgi:N-acetylglucosaminyldiphosphoundecaprenol N-acetyl-beta-D-mannosaminyltransferase